jgi:signal-transduction protein with cAMP-binding, CBS, and nucleotidyltransferase domain
MEIQSHIIDTIKVFDTEDLLENVIQFFRDSVFSHVAVKDNGRYLGVIAEDDLASFDERKKISDYRYSLETFSVSREATWLEVLEIFTRNETNLLPVLGEQLEVVGYYRLLDVLGLLVETPFFREPGGILVVAKGKKDHSFSEISQIIESNNTRILGAFITDIQNDVVMTTIKLSSENFNEVLQTFRRYNYSILFGTIHDQFLEDLKQRSDYLDKYLNV